MIIQDTYKKVLSKCPLPMGMLKKLGVAGFIFFTLKGMVWLGVFLWLYLSLE